MMIHANLLIYGLSIFYLFHLPSAFQTRPISKTPPPQHFFPSIFTLLYRLDYEDTGEPVHPFKKPHISKSELHTCKPQVFVILWAGLSANQCKTMKMVQEFALSKRDLQPTALKIQQRLQITKSKTRLEFVFQLGPSSTSPPISVNSKRHPPAANTQC